MAAPGWIELFVARLETLGLPYMVTGSVASMIYGEPRLTLDLDVVVTEWVTKRRFVSQLPKVFKGEHVNNPEVHVFRAREVTIESDRPFALYADGDRIADLPATVRVLPRAVAVLAPAAP